MKNRLTFEQFDHSSLQGKFLVASRELESTPFARTVVLVLQQNQEGVFGVVLNRPANQEMKRSWVEASGATSEAADRLLQGGPMGGPVFALHPIESLAEITVEPGVFLSAKFDAINKIVQSGDQRYRIICGLAGWRQEQLHEELTNGFWYPVLADQSIIFGDQEIAWERSLLRYGQGILCDILGVKELPGNPNRN